MFSFWPNTIRGPIPHATGAWPMLFLKPPGALWAVRCGYPGAVHHLAEHRGGGVRGAGGLLVAHRLLVLFHRPRRGDPSHCNFPAISFHSGSPEDTECADNLVN